MLSVSARPVAMRVHVLFVVLRVDVLHVFLYVCMLHVVLYVEAYYTLMSCCTLMLNIRKHEMHQ